jgi:hypothetical protein
MYSEYLTSVITPKVRNSAIERPNTIQISGEQKFSTEVELLELINLRSSG